jgi:hypothetical protein
LAYGCLTLADYVFFKLFVNYIKPFKQFNETFF